MIKQESFYMNGREFIRTYSDEGRYVVRDDVEYTEAQDLAEFHYQYIEGDLIPIEEEEDFIIEGTE